MANDKTEQIEKAEVVEQEEAPAEPKPPPFAEGDAVEIRVDGVTVEGRVASVDEDLETADVDYTHVATRRFSRILRPFAVGDEVTVVPGARVAGKIVEIDEKNGAAMVKCTQFISRAFSLIQRECLVGDEVEIEADGTTVQGKVLAVDEAAETADVEFRRISTRVFGGIQHLGT